MEEYKSNSHKSREQENQRREKVVTGVAKKKKQSEFSKFINSLILCDPSELRGYFIEELLIPSLKRFISEVMQKGTNKILYNGSSVSNDGRSSGSGTSKISYGRFWDPESDRNKWVRRRRLDYDEIEFPSYEDAERVMRSMNEILSEYHLVKVSDFYDLAGFTPEHTHYNYGWTSIASASIVSVPNGFIIKLPRPMPID